VLADEDVPPLLLPVAVALVDADSDCVTEAVPDGVFIRLAELDWEGDDVSLVVLLSEMDSVAAVVVDADEDAASLMEALYDMVPLKR
jgi:hypothetical protein